MDENADDPTFRDLVAEIFPDTQTARLARIADVSIRTAQKWLAGEVPVPADVEAWVREQRRLLDETDGSVVAIEGIVETKMAGVHKEVVAAHISAIYEKITGIKIR